MTDLERRSVELARITITRAMDDEGDAVEVELSEGISYIEACALVAVAFQGITAGDFHGEDE